MNLGQLAKLPFVSLNKFNLYSFYEHEHLDMGESSLVANVTKFLKNNGVTSTIKSIRLATNLNFLGYVFNPVSYYLIKDSEDREHIIIEICNTFNELKPYYVSPEHKNGDEFIVRTPKNFYISPFTPPNSEMEFKIRWGDHLKVDIEEFLEGEKILYAGMNSIAFDYTFKNLLLLTLKRPFNTFKIIFLIHYHALKLWLKKIPFFKKEDLSEFQKGYLVWKK